MWLENLKVRVKKYPRGWVVEIEMTKKTFFGTKKYWTHLISTSGMSDTPWHYSSKELAIKEAIKFFEWDILRN